MGVSEIRRLGIDPTQNVWDFSIFGDPSVSPGFVAAVGSRAVQFDSAPVGIVWYKSGTQATDWTKVFIDGTVRTITLADLPDLSAPAQRRDLDLSDNPLLAQAATAGVGAALIDGDVADVIFRLKAGAQ